MLTKLFQQVGQIAIFLFGIALIGYSIIALKNKQFKFGLLGIHTKPLITVALRGLPASMASAACILGGLIAVLPIAYLLFSGNTTINEAILGIITLAGLLIAVGGVALASVIQWAIHLGESIRSDSNDNDPV